MLSRPCDLCRLFLCAIVSARIGSNHALWIYQDRGLDRSTDAVPRGVGTDIGLCVYWRWGYYGGHQTEHPASWRASVGEMARPSFLFVDGFLNDSPSIFLAVVSLRQQLLVYSVTEYDHDCMTILVGYGDLCSARMPIYLLFSLYFQPVGRKQHENVSFKQLSLMHWCSPFFPYTAKGLRGTHLPQYLNTQRYLGR